MKKKYFKLLLVVFISVHCFGQREKKLQKAGRKFNQFAYIDAQKILLTVAQQGFQSKDLYQKLGDCFYFNADYMEANKWYQELMSNYSEEVKTEYFFRYAQSLKSVNNYKESDQMMRKFNASKREDSRAKKYRDEPEYLRVIDFQSGRYKVENIKANSIYSDFSPAFYGENIVFSSSRDTGIFSKRIYQWNGEPFLDLYKGKIKKKSKEISKIRKFSRRLNTKFHESSPTFNNSLTEVYFTRNNFNEGEYYEDNEGINNLKIYKSIRVGKSKWSKAISIRFNNDQYSVAHPALSPDNKKLYFSSDMPGGYGKSDLYVADINEDGTLGEAINLGDKINTEGKESFPFISQSGDLYFASNGHIGLGGMDLYVTSIDIAGNVKEVVNLGKPINTPYDDFSFIINEDEKIGYFSSNREGGKGGDDIYKFQQLEDKKENCEIVLSGIVKDRNSGLVLSGSQVTLFDSNNKIVKTMKVGKLANFSFVIECNKNYFLRTEKENYNAKEKLISTPYVSETLEVPFLLNRSVTLAKVGEDLGKILNLNPIYFDFDKSDIRYDASVELAKIIAVLKEYPTMKIDIRSHTDSRGDDEYNEELSNKRAKSTISYIISRGEIAASRISGKGYGESRPVNRCVNGIPCSQEDHQLNRRSEFIILSY